MNAYMNARESPPIVTTSAVLANRIVGSGGTPDYGADSPTVTLERRRSEKRWQKRGDQKVRRRGRPLPK